MLFISVNSSYKQYNLFTNPLYYSFFFSQKKEQDKKHARYLLQIKAMYKVLYLCNIIIIIKYRKKKNTILNY